MKTHDHPVRRFANIDFGERAQIPRVTVRGHRVFGHFFEASAMSLKIDRIGP